jgi:hypothetical protein
MFMKLLYGINPVNGLTLGSDRDKPLLFQGLFAGKRCYLALEPHFPYRNGRRKAAALEGYTNRPPADVVL